MECCASLCTENSVHVDSIRAQSTLDFRQVSKHRRIPQKSVHCWLIRCIDPMIHAIFGTRNFFFPPKRQEVAAANPSRCYSRSTRHLIQGAPFHFVAPRLSPPEEAVRKERSFSSSLRDERKKKQKYYLRLDDSIRSPPNLFGKIRSVGRFRPHSEELFQ